MVLHDELSLPPCTYKARFGGSARGHNGLRDIVARVRSQDFHRLCIGIGRPEDDRFAIADWCLSAAGREELEVCSENGSTTEAAWLYLQQIMKQ